MRVTMKVQIQYHSIGRFDGGAAMPIQSLKTHQNHTVSALFAGRVKDQGAQKRTRKPTSLRSSPSSTSLQRSILLQSEDEERSTPVVSKKSSTRPSSSDSHTPDFYKKTVGVLGGGSVITTMTFLEKLVYWSTKHGEGKAISVTHEESVPFIVCSDPCFSYSNGGQDLDPSKLRKKRVFLEEGGAGCIVMPCHVSHIWFDEISDECSLPFLNVAECVALELKEANLKPIEAGSNVRIGVIATDAVLTGGFYQEKLKKQGFEVVLPDRASMERIVIPAISALKRKDMEGAQNLLRIAIQMLLVRAVNVVILACDELHSLLPPDDPLLKQCIDPIDVLARSTVTYAKSAKR